MKDHLEISDDDSIIEINVNHDKKLEQLSKIVENAKLRLTHSTAASD